jgi:hypothetical protein
MSLPQLWWSAFIYFGWIPVVLMIWEIVKMNWLASRQAIYAKKLSFVLLSINVPRANEQTPKAMEHIFTHLAGAAGRVDFRDKWWRGRFIPPFSFELACLEGYTQFVVRTPKPMRDLIEAAVFSQYPEAEIVEIPDYSLATPHVFPDPEYDCWGGEFRLSKPNAYPIRTWEEFEHALSQEFKDPLSSLLESLSRLKKGEQVWLQIIIWPGDQEWVKEAAHVVAKMMGKEIKIPKPTHLKALHATTGAAEAIVREISAAVLNLGPVTEAKRADSKDMNKLSPGERKTLEAIEQKMSKIGFHSKMRMIYLARRDVYRAGPVISMVCGAMGLYGSTSGNSLRPYFGVSPRADYFWRAWSANKKKNAVLSAYQERSEVGSPPFVLNVEELASVWHFPQILVKAPMIKKVESKKVEPPFELPLA